MIDVPNEGSSTGPLMSMIEVSLAEPILRERFAALYCNQTIFWDRSNEIASVGPTNPNTIFVKRRIMTV